MFVFTTSTRHHLVYLAFGKGGGKFAFLLLRHVFWLNWGGNLWHDAYISCPAYANGIHILRRVCQILSCANSHSIMVPGLKWGAICNGNIDGLFMCPKPKQKLGYSINFGKCSTVIHCWGRQQKLWKTLNSRPAQFFWKTGTNSTVNVCPNRGWTPIFSQLGHRLTTPLKVRRS